MRDMTCRGKRLDNGEWAYGYLVCHGGLAFILETGYPIQNGDFYAPPKWWKQVDPATVGEYVGLPDKNKVDLYEHDIVKVSWLAELGVTELDCEAVGVIEYAQAEFRIRLVPPFKTGVSCGHDCPGTYEEEFMPLYQPEHWDEGYCVERIGNLTDTPDLLGGERRG